MRVWKRVCHRAARGQLKRRDSPGNGMIVVPRTDHGARGLYQCKDGYVLKVAED